MGNNPIPPPKRYSPYSPEATDSSYLAGYQRGWKGEPIKGNRSDPWMMGYADGKGDRENVED